MLHSDPLAYFLTWRTYGTWLPGDDRGWVTAGGNGFGEPPLRADHRLEQAALGQMRASPVEFTEDQRREVDRTLREACAFRGWHISALNVRTNHVHLVVSGDARPSKMLSLLKLRVTTLVRESGVFPPEQPIWARGGSKRLLLNERSMDAAVDYVLNRQ